MNEVFPDLSLIARGLDAAAIRHRVLAGNLANANTPGFVRYDVKFEELLKAQMGSARVDPMTFRAATKTIHPTVVQDRTGPFTNGNNVLVEKEASQISRNEILYNLYAEILSLKIGQIKHAIGSR